MIKVSLKDGSIKEVEKGISILELAKNISEGLARVATSAEVNGEVRDLRFKLEEDATVNILTFDSEEGKKAYWHTTTHIMAQAVKRLFPNTKLGIGPAIENGFYYDFKVDKPFDEEDIKKIEEEANKIIKEDIEIKRFTLPREEAIKFMSEKNEDYKVELIKELPEDEEISFYEQGEYVDLCAGPHLESTGKVKKMKILNTSAAYWKGDQENDSMQRIYGISFPKASMLDDYLNMIEEAKKRDHRKLGRELDLFFFDETAPGMAYWMPKGFKMMNILIDLWRKEHEKRGYMEFSDRKSVV